MSKMFGMVTQNLITNPIINLWKEDVKKMNRKHKKMVKEAEARVAIESDLLRVRNEVTWHEMW